MELNNLEKLTDKYLKLFSTNNINDLDEEYLYKIYPEIISVVNYHNKLYYLDSSPIISDYQYDKLFNILKDIEKQYPAMLDKNSPTQKLTYQIQKEFKKAKHNNPMLSLENTYNAQDLLDWKDYVHKILQKHQIEAVSFLSQPKFDGLSIELVYEYGRFKQAITRGDGTIGEDVTENVRTIFDHNGVPKIVEGLKNIDTVSFRGEIMLSKSQLEKINNERTKMQEAIFSNTRNAASGSLRQLDPNVTKSRGLKCFVYEVLDGIEHFDVKSDYELMKILSDYGFLTLIKLNHRDENIDQVITRLDENVFFENPIAQDFEFDGVVIKIDELYIRSKLGFTNHHPRRAVAYKFQAKQIVTQLLSVEYGVSRNGLITPVANLKTVEMGGVKVSRATLHNFDYIKEKDIRINDYVWIQRSGEVIPYILGPVLDRRNADNQSIIPPENCPVCGAKVIKLTGEVFRYCSNINCPAVIKEKLAHFVSKNCMDIDGLGDKIIEILVDSGVIKHFSDIYKLGNTDKRTHVQALPGMGSKRFNELLLSIDNSKNAHLWRILHSLGVNGIGKKMAKDIETAILQNVSDVTVFGYNDLIKFMTDVEFLSGIYGVGEKLANNSMLYFSTPQNYEIIKELSEIGVKFNNFENVIIENQNEGINGKRFSITGKFDYSRSKIISALEQYGAKFDDTPTKNTNFMIVGDSPGSKLSKAIEHNVDLIYGIDGLKEFCPYVNFDKDIQEDQNSWSQGGLF